MSKIGQYIQYYVEGQDEEKILKENIDTLKKTSTVYSVVCITQVRNLEDELVRSCNIKAVRELTGSKTDSEYKSKLISATNLAALLAKHGFDVNKFWSKKPDGLFSEFINEAGLIKK